MILILILEIQCRYQSDSSDSPGTDFTAVINVALFQSLSIRLKFAPRLLTAAHGLSQK